ncbi:MAG: hypothetical protein MUO87_00440, partial [Thermoplasmata archaeon]|nr:hypothetical protein [Thermoplasmata archaeon]
MRGTAISAIAVAVLFGTTAFACVVSAEEEGDPLVITMPSEEGGIISCAVFYADNMVYGPQWRIGNFVRIEAMILNMDDYGSTKGLKTTDTELDPDLYTEDWGTQQGAIIADSETFLPLTKMISVSYIEMTITGPGYDEDNP